MDKGKKKKNIKKKIFMKVLTRATSREIEMQISYLKSISGKKVIPKTIFIIS